MSAGPATKMRAALVALLGPPNREHGLEASYLVGTISPEDCEAMDAAAEAMSARDPEEAAFPLRCRDDGEGLYIRDRNLDYFFLHPAEQAQLLRELFTRFIQRRKEAGNG